MKNLKLSKLPTAALCTVILLSGCKMGDDYQKPDLEKQISPQWSSSKSPEFSSARADLARWWEAFKDPKLSELIQRAARDNLDLRAARARILQARALVSQTNASRLPVVSAEGRYTRTGIAPDAVQANTQTFGGFRGPDTVHFDQYSTGLQASWELDLFGRVARQVEAANYAAQATLDDYHNTIATLMADIARNYIEICSLNKRLQILKRNIESQKQSMQLAQIRSAAGIGTELDALQAKASWASLKARRPELERQLTVAFNRLAVLTGQRPKGSAILRPGPLPKPPNRFYLGIPADLVARRPDIRSAERRVAEARARVGAAVAEYFPRVSINGSFEFRAADAADLIDSQARTWNVGPVISAPIFRGGEISAQVNRRRAELEQSQYQLQQTVIKAAEDVENAISGIRQGRRQQRDYNVAVKSSRENLALSKTLYESGNVDFQRVIDAQRQVASVEDEQALVEQQFMNQIIALYRALGGGWQPEPKSSESKSD